MTTKDRITAERALTDLQNMGFSCAKGGWRELTQRIEEWERGAPSEEDLRLTVPLLPPGIASHFEGKNPEVLSAATLWKGYHYTLTAGMRRWFREHTALTPSRTVTVAWVETWPGTSHPRSFKVVSDVHVDPKNRKHTLIEWVVKDVGRFFQTCTQYDEEERVSRIVNLNVLGPVNVWRGVHTRAVKILTGRKVIGDAEDVSIVETEPYVKIKDAVGNTFEFDKEEFQSVVTDLELKVDRNGEAGGDKGGTVSFKSDKPVAKSVDELMEMLARGEVP